MTDSENSQPQNDSDDDIYKDIPEFNFEDELAKLEGSKETYKQEANDLSEKVKALTEENKDLKKSNEILKKNLSTLLKTAQAEVRRKDSMIEELRGKVNSFTFRRNRNTTSEKSTSTDDLELNTESKCKEEKEKCVGDKKRSKSYENCASSDIERKSNQEEEKKKESFNEKEENENCDNYYRKFVYYRENTKNSRHPDNSHETYNDKYKERKSSRFEDSSECRRSYREHYRDHLKYDSFDKKRHSRSSDSRFISRRRNSRERRDERRRGDSYDRRRRGGESSERCRISKKDRSRSREICRKSKESSLEIPKSRSSLDKDSFKVKEPLSFKSEISDRAKNNIVENKKQIENSERRQTAEEDEATNVKNNSVKEKRSDKPEKRSSLDIFNAKSPLDVLYKDMITSRSSNRLPNSKSGTDLAESDLEEGELFSTETIKTSENQPKEDWTLSFKNERQNETKSITLYSRRMMRKFSSETKKIEKLDKKEEKFLQEKFPLEETEKTACKKVCKIEEMEKEPGELTDDENVVESSVEFQELTKVASIECELIENGEEKKTLKKAIKRETFNSESAKSESIVKDSNNEVDKEESSAFKKNEPNKDTYEVIEFSPFKSNYKLIEISPIKPSDKEHVLDFYKRISPTQVTDDSPNISEEKTASEKSPGKPLDTSEGKNSWKNSSSEKESETELKIVVPSGSESPKKQDKKTEKEKKELKIKKEKKEVKKSKSSKDDDDDDDDDDSDQRKRKPVLKERENLATEEKSSKRKRKLSEIPEESSNRKKKKTEKIEPSRKSTRSKRNSKSERESKFKSEPEAKSVPEPEPEPEKIKEDISSFEFFRPVAKTESMTTVAEVDRSICASTDYKMTTTMSVSGVVRLETPNKCVEKLKNLIINEQMIFNILDSKNNSQFSPLIGSKCMEMTPRRMLRNDLMLTDSEDDSINKKHAERSEDGGAEQEEMEEEEEDEVSGAENSECDSDSGASDFVDLL